jgi:hypothetical protein
MSFFATNSRGEFIRLQILETVEKTAPHAGMTRTGYGSRIPCGYLARVHLFGKFYRVYCRIFSNIGTCYIVVGGKRFIVES